MKREKQENVINENINTQAEELADLAVSDEQAEQAKGGIVPTDQVSVNFAKVEFEYKPQK